MSWWDAETEELAQQVTARYGDDALAEAVLRAVDSSLKERGHAIEGRPHGIGVSTSDLQAALEAEFRKLLSAPVM
jgi:hypothetical protein